MSCRSTNAGSAFIAFSRWENGKILSDPACLSVFHELRRSYRTSPSNTQPLYTRENYIALVADMRQRVEQRPTLSPKRRASLLERLETAEQDPTPSQEMLFALDNIRSRISQRSERLHDFLKDISRRSRSSFDETLQRFRLLESQAPRERTHRALTGYTSFESQDLDFYGLGREQGMAHAALQLIQETRTIEMSMFRQSQQRILTASYKEPIVVKGLDVAILAAGYDERNGRLEIDILQAGNSRKLAYRRVPEEHWKIFNPSNDTPLDEVGAHWRGEIRGNSKFEYSSKYEMLQDGVAPRCSICGRFANNQHGCPVTRAPRDMHTWTTRSRWSNQQIATTEFVSLLDEHGNEICESVEATASISLPAIRELQNAIREEPVRIRDISYRHSQLYPHREGFSVKTFTTTGDVVAWADDEGIQVNISELRCPCPEYLDNYTCQHVRDVEQAVLERVSGAYHSTGATPEERLARMRRAQERAEAAGQLDWTNDPSGLADAAKTWRTDSETSYFKNFAAFKSAYTSALEIKAATGEIQIPYYIDNVLDGASRRGSGKAFGIELEYEFPSDWTLEQRQAANAVIAQKLYTCGLTWSDRIQPYQSSKARGFRDRQSEPSDEGNWTLEKDGSVNGGELVSPGLYDEEDTWTNLTLALRIIREEGGIASKKAGFHVHVGTSDFHGDPATYTELARLMAQHEDVIYRLSTDPHRGTHRKGRFARPIPDVPPEGFRDAASLAHWQGMGKYWAANFNSVRGGNGDHPEFRVFDSTLDSGAIQAQIKLSVALTEAAKRQAALSPTSRGKEPLGSHAARRAGRRTRRPLTDEELSAETATTRSLLDTLFRRDEDKNHLISVFAHTKWPR